MESNALIENKTKSITNEMIVDSMFSEIEQIILTNKTKMSYQINNTLIDTYYNIGKL